MKSQLITLSRGKSLLPYISIGGLTSNTVTLTKGQAGTTLNPQTHNLTNASQAAGTESGGYKFTVVNFNYLTSMTTPNDQGSPNELDVYGGTEAIAEHVTGDSVSLVPTNEDALFPSSTTSLTTTLIIEGMTTGARKTLQIIVNKS
jgi:hypothetical protein